MNLTITDDRKWIIIENLWSPYICMNEEGEILWFDSEKEAKKYAKGKLHNPKFVSITKNY